MFSTKYTKIATIVATLTLPLFLTACDDDNDNDNTTTLNQSLTQTQVIPTATQDCALGGLITRTGIDQNNNQTLDDDEITDESQVCYQSGEQSGARLIGRYASGVYGLSAAEIVDFDATRKQIYVVNAVSGQVDIIDASPLQSITDTPSDTQADLNLNNLTHSASLDVAADLKLENLGGVNSLAIKDDLLAVAIERGVDDDSPTQANGFVAFYRLSDAGPTFIQAVEVGALPDNVSFSPDGNYLLVANEGEPNAAYDNDPEGSVAIIKINDGQPEANAQIADFTAFNQGGALASQITSEIKINGPQASVAQDLEPEYLTVSADSTTAWVSLQENNAIAKIDIASASVTNIYPLGFKDLGLEENALDASNKDDGVHLQSYPGLFAMYQPDTIASYQVDGQTYILSANEGDARDYDGFSEESRIEDLTIDSNFASYAATQDEAMLGRLNVTTSFGDTDMDGDFDELYAYGGRSFSIWSEDGALVFDSANEFERISAALLGDNFNNNNEENNGDNRSDDKGVEPEALAVGEINGTPYAFIGLERQSGIMIYDISDPVAPKFVDYLVNRDFETEFEVDTDTGEAEGDIANVGDLGPEGFKFVPAEKSLNGKPWLIIGNEVSGTTSVYQFDM